MAHSHLMPCSSICIMDLSTLQMRDATHALSVHPFVMFVHYVDTSKHIFKTSSPPLSQTIIDFLYQALWQYSDG